jgi:putative ABC transport system ATP-binding protein
MAGLNAREGTTFVFSTHDSHIMNEARRVVRIMDGEIVDDGTGTRPRGED